MKIKEFVDSVAESLYYNGQYVVNEEQPVQPKQELEEPEFLKQRIVLPCGTFLV